MKRYLFSVLICNSIDLKLNRMLRSKREKKKKRRITSPESAMITSTEGLSPDPFGTFSVAIKDMRGTAYGGNVLTN